MPEQRLEKARASLPKGYQFCDSAALQCFACSRPISKADKVQSLFVADCGAFSFMCPVCASK